VLEEVGDVVHAVLGQRGEEARHLVGQRQALGRRLGGRDEPARDEAEVAHAARHERRVGELRLVAEHALLHRLHPLLELGHLRLHLHDDVSGHLAGRAQPEELLLTQLQVTLPVAKLLL